MKLRYRLQTHRYAVWKNLVVMTFRVLSAEKKKDKKNRRMKIVSRRAISNAFLIQQRD